MDFGTIKGKADRGVYASPHDFRADVELVFSNACRYNSAGTDVHIMATTLKVLPSPTSACMSLASYSVVLQVVSQL